jgi:serine/threonine-protein kinase
MAALMKRGIKAAGTELHGQLAGEYRILRKLGTGGFGTVYEAEHPVLKRRAAVKVLHAMPAVDSVAVQRFIEEARSASQIRHRHIVDIFSFGTLPNGQYFYVMDLLEGAPLDRYLAEHGKLAPEVALPLLRPIASAIDALHAASIVHRDVKPANIFLAWDSSGELVPKLLDFGLVKLLGQPSHNTASGVPMGTPFYMSPEQCRGEKIDARADVYSFGVICFELLTGRRPFTGDSATSVLVAHVLQPPPRMSEVSPELSIELDEPVLHMLAKDPQDRPASASAALRELELSAQGAGVTLGGGLPWLPRPTNTTPAGSTLESDATVEQSGLRDASAVVAERNAKRRRLLVGAGVFLVLAVGLAFALRPDSDPQSAAPPEPPVVVPAAKTPVVSQPSAAGVAARTDAPPQPEATEKDPTVPLMLRGVPDGAEVWLGDDKLGEAPGPIALPRGDELLRLSVRGRGFGPRMLSVTPNVPLDVTLPARSKTGASKRDTLSRDLENPF